VMHPQDAWPVTLAAFRADQVWGSCCPNAEN
jgi:hypothetical protein